MLSSQGIAVLLLCAVGQAIPRHDMRNPLDEAQRELAIQPRHFEPVSDNVGIPITSSTNYRTMPPGTYTESISSGLVRIIVVNPTPTTTNGICPADCDCSGIKDKQSPEYFQCLTSSRCRPCRQPEITSSAKPTVTCPPGCDCTKFKDKQSEEYAQCLVNPNCRSCRVGGSSSSI